MGKGGTKKQKRTSTICDDDLSYDPSVFDIRDRHYKTLQAFKKKIRACEKKIRELEQAEHHRTSCCSRTDATSSEVATIREQRLEKIQKKRTALLHWKEAVMIVASTRKDELVQGVTDVSIADVHEGLALLKELNANKQKWSTYKCPSKKHLMRVDVDRLLQLAQYLNVDEDAGCQSHFSSFQSVVSYLSSPVAIGQKCPMSFPEFVKMFDKVRKTLEVEIVSPKTQVVSETVTVNKERQERDIGDKIVMTSSDASLTTVPIPLTEAVAAQVVQTEKPRRRFPKERKREANATRVAGVSASSQPPVVVVTDNTKNKRQTVVGDKDKKEHKGTLQASVVNVSSTKHSPARVASPISRPGNPNVPMGNLSDDEGWERGKEHTRKTTHTTAHRGGQFNRGGVGGGQRQREDAHNRNGQKPRGNVRFANAKRGGATTANFQQHTRFQPPPPSPISFRAQQ